MSILKRGLRLFWKKDAEKYEKEISALTSLLNEYREKEKYEKYVNYITIPVPRSKDGLAAFNEFLAGLGKSEQFLFYLHTIENEIIAKFTDGKGEDLYRGGLRVIQKIRTDTRDSIKIESKKNADQAV